VMMSPRVKRALLPVGSWIMACRSRCCGRIPAGSAPQRHMSSDHDPATLAVLGAFRVRIARPHVVPGATAPAQGRAARRRLLARNLLASCRC
jgi:hypothetical protein